ncbi:hypothetical protein PHLCEN_2v13544 [Hermanssonia centrifuga]|uniref:Uncharacterized protein n=1 Tax=Hermanssonia centrifuga TaxID=98765 RepID=A0A2R6NDY5_9APHY|nr:hypothetical protein PHLCEN_2v13544 [Hermanssonia centrifuga]
MPHQVAKKIEKTIEKIPGLGPLIEKIMDSVSVFVFTTLEPFLRPLMKTATTQLMAASGEVINKQDQYEVFNDPRASDPTHSFLSKDHFNLILNEPAGNLGKIVLTHAVTLVVKAWDDQSMNVSHVVEDILSSLFHPDFHDRNSKIQSQMMEYMQKWVQGLGNKQNEILHRLSKDSIRNHQNIRLGGEGGVAAAQGSYAQNAGLQTQHDIQGYVSQIPIVGSAANMIGNMGGSGAHAGGHGGAHGHSPAGMMGNMGNMSGMMGKLGEAQSFMGQFGQGAGQRKDAPSGYPNEGAGGMPSSGPPQSGYSSYPGSTEQPSYPGSTEQSSFHSAVGQSSYSSGGPSFPGGGPSPGFPGGPPSQSAYAPSSGPPSYGMPSESGYSPNYGSSYDSQPQPNPGPTGYGPSYSMPQAPGGPSFPGAPPPGQDFPGAEPYGAPPPFPGAPHHGHHHGHGHGGPPPDRPFGW